MGPIRRLALAALALCAPAVASAVPITVDFTVTTTTTDYSGYIAPGYQPGVVGSGWFTFDYSNQNVPEGTVALDLSVSWLGRTWDETTARIGYVFFNANGPGASHVGIATSNSTAISATSHGVMEHAISDSYWGSHYVGARRV